MAITNLAVGQSINLAGILNTKLEAPVKQADVTLDVPATVTGEAVRFDEFSLKHNNDGSFKGIKQGDLALDIPGQNPGQAIRWNEFLLRHTSSGTIVPMNYNKSSLSNPSATINTYGTVVPITPPTGFMGLYPHAVSCIFGGTFGTETVTAQLVVTYSDGSTQTIPTTSTATGTIYFTNANLAALIKDSLYITQTAFSSSSTIANSAVTVTCNIIGNYL